MTYHWDDSFADRLETEAIWPVIVDVAEKVLNDANRGILSPPKTGRIYHRKGRTHQASAPGEFPANDFGNLVASSYIVEDRANLTCSVVWPLDYAWFLTAGTRYMAPRPFPQMALTQNVPSLLTGLTGSINMVLR